MSCYQGSVDGRTYTLHGGGKRTEDDQIVKLPWLVPSVSDLTTEQDLVVLVQLRQTFERRGVLRDKSALLEVLDEIFHVVLPREPSSIGHKLLLRDAFEWIGENRIGVGADGVNLANGAGAGG